MIIDAHRHFRDDRAEIERYFAECEAYGIGQTWLSCCGRRFDQPGDAFTADMMKKRPDLVRGFGYVRLGIDGAAAVRRFRDEGFTGIKVILPRVPYDSPECCPVYAAAEELRMPVTFHTGLLPRLAGDEALDTSCVRMMPILLDPVARRFPSLILILAHVGYPFCEDAYLLARNQPNVYLDLAGNALTQRPPAYFARVFESEHGQDLAVWRKVMFCTDRNDVADKVPVVRGLLDAVGLDSDTQDAIWHGTAERILSGQAADDASR